jgi:hypothetical protein
MSQADPVKIEAGGPSVARPPTKKNGVRNR